MSVIGQNILAGASGAGGDYDIDYSLRCDGGSDAHSTGGSSSYLHRGPVSSGTGDSQRKFTGSFWVKIGSGGLYFTDTLNIPVRTFYSWNDGNGSFNIGMGPTNATEGLFNLKISSFDSGGGIYFKWETNALFRDTNAWYHIVVNIDSTQATQTNRIKCWVNNEEITSWLVQTRPDHNQDMYINGAGHVMLNNFIGATFRTVNSTIYNYWDGYLAEIHALDGIIKSPSDFGELDPITNMWKAKEYTGLYGTTGIYLNFDDSSDIGNDSSGNNNDFTNTNFAVSDQMIATPQNSTGGDFATWNPLGSLNEPAKPPVCLYEGDLKAVSHTSTGNDNFFGTIMPSTGKWYAECRVGLANTKWQFMLNNQHHSAEATAPGFTDCIMWRNQDGYLNNQNGGWTSWGNTFATGDILQVAWDMDNRKMWFGKDNTWEVSGNPATGANPAVTLPAGPDVWTMGIMFEDTSANNGTANFGQDSTFAGTETAQNNKDGNNNGDFYYTPPTGFLALCTNNLPEPSIKLPADYFQTVLYTGNATARAITGAGFAPDMTWLKRRSTPTASNSLYDTVRGATKQLITDATDMQSTYAQGLTAFDSDGFSLGTGTQDNGNTYTYVSWNWLAGGTPTVDNSAGAGYVPTAGSVKINGSNSGSALAGSIAATRLTANTTSGFSICSFTGNETAGATVAHGLSVAPEWVIAKCYVQGGGAATSVWYSQPLTIGSDIQGEGSVSFDTGAYDDYAGYWNDTAPSSSVVTLGAYSNLNRSSNVIMYSFHSVEGYSKAGSYQGNGDSQVPKSGKFIYLGFRPKYFLIKNITQSEGWVEWDNAREPNFNLLSKKLSLNTTDAEYTANTTTYAIDFVSNGVKLRTNYSAVNDVNDYFFYMAFAEWPYKYTRAR